MVVFGLDLVWPQVAQTLARSVVEESGDLVESLPCERTEAGALRQTVSGELRRDAIIITADDRFFNLRIEQPLIRDEHLEEFLRGNRPRKRTCFTALTQERLDEIATLLNERTAPRCT